MMDGSMAAQHEREQIVTSNVFSVEDLHSFNFNFRNGSKLRLIRRHRHPNPASAITKSSSNNMNIQHHLPSSSSSSRAITAATTTRETPICSHLLRLRNSLGRALGQRVRIISSQLSCKHGDHNQFESFMNVVTSIPFIFIGLQSPRNTMRNKIYANCLIGVGATSSLYHTSRGNARTFLRWGDYAMISTSAICLTRALRKENTNTLMLASAILLPVSPSLVTVVHTGITEVMFFRRVKSNPSLRSVYRTHAASGILGCALYVADGIFPEKPFIHAAWHLAAAITVATYSKLLS